MENERAFRGIWIPADIWLSKDLSLIEKVMLVEIDSLDNEEGCYANNNYFAEFFGISKTRVSQIISSLKEKKIITTEEVYTYKNTTKRVIRVTGYPFNKLNPPLQKTKAPPLEKFKHNNTNNNNTNNNKREIEKDLNTFNLYQKHFGIMNANTFQTLNSWIEDFNKNQQGDEIVSEAIKIAVSKNAKSFKYVETILKNWFKDNVQTLEQAKQQTEPNQRKTKQQQKTEEKNSFWENKLKGVSGNEW